MTTAIPQPSPLSSDALTEDANALRHRSIIQGLAAVQHDQEKLRLALADLESHVVTLPALEDIVKKQLMTKQDFEAQRAKDLQDWQPMIKQRLTKRWLLTSLAGMGCFMLVVMFFMTLITAGGMLLLTRVFSL